MNKAMIFLCDKLLLDFYMKQSNGMYKLICCLVKRLQRENYIVFHVLKCYFFGIVSNFVW